jgi:hypothetical protein
VTSPSSSPASSGRDSGSLSLCLEEKQEWRTVSRRELADIHYSKDGTVRPEAVGARKAFDLAATGRYSQACDELQKAMTRVTDPTVRGWLAAQRAAYLHHIDQPAAQALHKALDDNPRVLRPAGGPPGTAAFDRRAGPGGRRVPRAPNTPTESRRSQ